MDAVVKFTGQSQGKDRIFRTTQYACALSIYLLRNSSDRKDLVAKLKSLETTMSAGRKLFRLGNTVNSVEAARQSARLSDRVLCLCLTAGHLGRALYFACDNLLWARKVGLVRGVDKARWSLNASRCYLLSLVMGLTRDAYVLGGLMARQAKDERFRKRMDRHLADNPEVADVVVPQLDAFLFLLLAVLKEHPAVALDTLKNVCDLFIPLDRLGIYQSNAGVVGFCGLMSSLMGILTLAQPDLKIKP